MKALGFIETKGLVGNIDATDAMLKAADVEFIGSDTIVTPDGVKALGKPRDRGDAVRTLTELSGNRHTVCTGVSVRLKERSETFCVSTDVFFRNASQEELLAYIKSGEPMDKAGAYGVQGLGALLVERIDGDFYNVMGLPLEALGRALSRFGLKLL